MLQSIAKRLLKSGGWTTTGAIPDLKKAVFIAYPHTSNWDGYWMLVYKTALQLKIKFMAKKSLFWFPLGNLLRAFGAISLDRKKASSTVDQMVSAFARSEQLFMLIAPEGTRSAAKNWKNGFLRIAHAAKVPVVLCYIDYVKREIGIGPNFMSSGDFVKDMRFVRDYYQGVRGCHPEKQGPIKLAMEDKNPV